MQRMRWLLLFAVLLAAVPGCKSVCPFCDAVAACLLSQQ